MKRNDKYYVDGIVPGSICDKFTDLKRGQRIIKFNDKPMEAYQGIKQLHYLLKDEMRFEVEVANCRSSDEIFKEELEKVKVDTRDEFRANTEEKY